ncbi:hypothetical protein M501DRAFT_289531 [Patellaria atrata CBS 101060]|uniref:Zn(2)-C6 fungal-type domain-containing protein n=1 Tax=Patellaria atrata CBS 101060 TaxID=1346257 RepID=A0A9P4S3V6_9PEZI|nr:hypothetical protein M501DRAFT_289531 [Patellaria atrata CBS 101060]
MSAFGCNGKSISKKIQKLKDTCDMCSVSKVKCSKEKPHCARCEKLDFPCVYSPARRMGRPHPHRDKDRKAKVKDQELQFCSKRATSETVDPGFSVLENETYNSSTRSSSSKPHNITCGFINHDLNSLPLGQQVSNQMDEKSELFKNPDKANNTTLSRESSCRSSRLSKAESRPADGRKSPISGLGDVHSESEYTSSIRSSYDPISGVFTLCNTSIHTKSHSSTVGPFSGMRTPLNVTNDEGSPRGTGKPQVPKSPSYMEEFDLGLDCATTVMLMLQDLNMMDGIPKKCNKGADPPSVHVILNLASVCIRRISKILICPCSQKTEVGLLVAVVCNAILDVYTASLRAPRQQLTSRGYDGRNMIDLGTWDISGEKTSIMSVLEELPKIANLIVQFTKRYQDIEHHLVLDFLPALAVSLKVRLKSVISEAIDSVVKG